MSESIHAPHPSRGRGERTPAHQSGTKTTLYFSVEGADASTARAQELGGTVVDEPFDVTVGRTAWLLDGWERRSR
jgi:predicted enzyme related to lactoylglutathione lyase